MQITNEEIIRVSAEVSGVCRILEIKRGVFMYFRLGGPLFPIPELQILLLVFLVISVIQLWDRQKRRKNGEEVSRVGWGIATVIFCILLGLNTFIYIINYVVWMRSM